MIFHAAARPNMKVLREQCARVFEERDVVREAGVR